MKRFFWLATLIASSMAASAFAQDAHRGEAPEQVYDFRDHAVPGSRVSSEGEALTVRNRASRTSLIRARGHFVPELVTSIERL